MYEIVQNNYRACFCDRISLTYVNEIVYNIYVMMISKINTETTQT